MHFCKIYGIQLSFNMLLTALTLEGKALFIYTSYQKREMFAMLFINIMILTFIVIAWIMLRAQKQLATILQMQLAYQTIITAITFTLV